MSQAKKAKDRQKLRLPPFVPLTWELLNSAAYIALPPSAAKALPYFIGKAAIAAKKGENEFEFSYKEAERLGFTSRTFSRIIEESIAKGFFEITRYGGLKGFCKSNTKFRESNAWTRYGTPDFKSPRRYPSEPGNTGYI